MSNITMTDTLPSTIPSTLAEILFERFVAARGDRPRRDDHTEFRIVGTRTETIGGQTVEVKLVESAYDKFRSGIETGASRVYPKLPFAEKGGRVWVHLQR